MGGATQILLVVMLLTLGSTLTIIGVQIFLILREVREGMQKVNAMLEDGRLVTSQLTENIRDLRQRLNSPWVVAAGIAELVRSLVSQRRSRHD